MSRVDSASTQCLEGPAEVLGGHYIPGSVPRENCPPGVRPAESVQSVRRFNGYKIQVRIPQTAQISTDRAGDAESTAFLDETNAFMHIVM
jgi:hypothetical protein